MFAEWQSAVAKPAPLVTTNPEQVCMPAGSLTCIAFCLYFGQSRKQMQGISCTGNLHAAHRVQLGSLVHAPVVKFRA